jgi:hypothetical protein
MRFELKVCERCGNIWLRPIGRGWVYCSPCYPLICSMRVVPRRVGSRAVRLPRLKKAGSR